MSNTPEMPSRRTLSLDELAQMTREIQEADVSGTLGPDGRPLKSVKTVDLTVRDNYDPLENAAVKKEVSLEEVAGIAADSPVTQYVPPALRSKALKPTPIEEIAPMKEPEKLGAELQNKWINDLNDAIERDKQAQWNNVVMPLMEKEIEKKALAELGAEDDIEMGTPLQTSKTLIEENDSYKIDEGDLDMDDNYQTTPPSFEENEFTFEEAATPPPAQPVQPEIPTAPIVANIPKAPEPIDVPEPEQSISDIDLDDVFGEGSSSELVEASEEEENYELSEEEQKEEIAAMQQKIRQEIRPITKVIDIGKFKVASKPINASRVLSNLTTNKAIHTANWYLPNAGRPFTMSELAGPEIEKLNPSAETGLSELMRNRERYGIFYEHIVDNNKPASFEAWAKTIPYDDVSALYYGAYRASFSHGSNLLPYYCTNKRCNHSFMEHKSIDSMIKFSNDEAKERAKTIMAMDPSGLTLALESKLFQVSDDLCISFHTPSIYNVEFEIPVLPKKFRERYEELMYYISCIETVYQIDHTNNLLVPMATKVEPDNINKTVANKYKAYAAVLQRLTADQYYSIYSYIKDVKENHNDEVTFEYPETECPKCHTKIAAAPTDSMTMLFTRLRLPTILVL